MTARHYKNKSTKGSEAPSGAGLSSTSGENKVRARSIFRREQSRRASLLATDEADPIVVPEYVRCCSLNPDVPKVYSFWTWLKQAPGTRTRVPYVCNSWRCPHCQRHAAAVVFARVQEAFEPFSPSDCVFIVLTLDPAEHARGEHDLAGVYRSLRRYVERLFGFWKTVCTGKRKGLGLDWCGSRWVSVVEAHRTGVPHINIVMHAPKLAQYLREQYTGARAAGMTHREATLLRGPFLEAAEGCGFGWSSTMEAADATNPGRANLDSIAGYIAKVAKNTDALHGEIAKLTQLPLQAPKNFHRVRSGKGFLPPKRKNEAWTGAVIRRFRTREGDEQAESLVRKYKDPMLAAQVDQAVKKEQELAYEDEEVRAGTPQGQLIAYARQAEGRVQTFHLTTDEESG